MALFSIRFLISNLYIALFIAILYTVKRLLKKQLSWRMQYRLWFFMLILLPFPFLPFQSAVFFRITSWISSLQRISGDLASYWLESDLKISPFEQAALLKNFYHNTFAFAPENIEAVKKAIRITSSPDGSLYGKTGTGQIDGQEIRGWFIGFVEHSEYPVFFACYIQDETKATGSRAADITYSILEDRGIWKQEP